MRVRIINTKHTTPFVYMSSMHIVSTKKARVCGFFAKGNNYQILEHVEMTILSGDSRAPFKVLQMVTNRKTFLCCAGHPRFMELHTPLQRIEMTGPGRAVGDQLPEFPICKKVGFFNELSKGVFSEPLKHSYAMSGTTTVASFPAA